MHSNLELIKSIMDTRTMKLKLLGSQDQFLVVKPLSSPPVHNMQLDNLTLRSEKVFDNV